jgi:peptidoglycan/LPS O-acetylase OafA/YrhL
MLTDTPAIIVEATAGMVLAGASIIVVVAICWVGARRVLEARTIQWLGAISFSLYLIHEPIVVASGFYFGPDNVLVAICVAILISMVLAPIFRRFIEVPSHQLARKFRTHTLLEVTATADQHASRGT